MTPAELKKRVRGVLIKVDTLKTYEVPQGNPFIPGNLSVNEAKQKILNYIDEHYTPNSQLEEIKREAFSNGHASAVHHIKSYGENNVIAELSKEQSND